MIVGAGVNREWRLSVDDYRALHVAGNDPNDRVLLQGMSALTLYQGAMTAGRRSAPVPQLTCVGGTAGCGVGQPKVVQCYNRGWDGYDVQVQTHQVANIHDSACLVGPYSNSPSSSFDIVFMSHSQTVRTSPLGGVVELLYYERFCEAGLK